MVQPVMSQIKRPEIILDAVECREYNSGHSLKKKAVDLTQEPTASTTSSEVIIVTSLVRSRTFLNIFFKEGALTMKTKKVGYKLPKWIRDPSFKQLTPADKDFLGYLYSFGPNTNWQWDCRFMKKWRVSRSTIQRRLRKFKDLAFIWIENPGTIHRLIHVRILPTPDDWVRVLGIKALGKGLRRHSRFKKKPPDQGMTRLEKSSYWGQLRVCQK